MKTSNKIKAAAAIFSFCGLAVSTLHSAIAADDTNRLAGANREVDVPQRPMLGSLAAPAPRRQQPTGEDVVTVPVLHVALPDALQIDRETYELKEGDCLDFDVMRPLVYENRTARIVHYLVVVRRL